MENSEQNSKNVIVKKSTFNNLIIAIVTASIIAAFLGGYMLGIQTDGQSEIVINKISDVNSNLQKPVSSPQEQFGPQIIRNISLGDDPMRGNPDAAITIVEFSDFQCPFCAKFHQITLPLIEQNYISTGKVNFVYRDFPIQSTHPNAIPAAHTTECADDQGKFWQMHDMIFENQQTWKNLAPTDSVILFKEYAVELGLDSTEFESCMDSGKYLTEIAADLQDGREYGVTGTPAFFVGNEEIGFTKLIGAQPFSSFQRVIDGQLNR